MPFSVHDSPNTTQIPAAGNHAQITRVKLDEVEDFGGGNLHLDCVIDIDYWVWVPNGAAVVGHKEWDSFRAGLDSLDLAQFVLHKDRKNWALVTM